MDHLLGRSRSRCERSTKRWAQWTSGRLVVAPVDDLLSVVRTYAPTQAKRVEFAFAPDEFHKANYSGGDDYHLWLPNPDADVRIEGMYEIEEYFVAYLRATFVSRCS